MESSHSIHPPQVLGQSPFFYYNPEPGHREHGHFSSHPSAAQDGVQMQQYHQQMYQQEMMMRGQSHIYARPSSAGSQFYLPSKPSLPTQPIITPMVSPRPLPQKPAFLYQQDGLPLSLDTECGAPDLYVYPSTPPLSVSGSAISSPPSTCGILPTPTTGAFFTLENIEGVKEGCEGDVQSEILAGGDWTRSCSPPLTPGTFSGDFLRCWNLFMRIESPSP